MAIVDLFSKRQKRLRGEVVDVYTYDTIPDTLRVQIAQILGDILGTAHDYRVWEDVRNAFHRVVKTLRREYGVPHLTIAADGFNELMDYLQCETTPHEHVLDAVELSFQVAVEATSQGYYLDRPYPRAWIAKAIEELNHRFREHGVGYQFTDGQIIRIDSELVHAEVMKPALRLVSNPDYAGVQDEFLSAHEHYRAGNAKEALVDCLKAFESMMKAICDKRGWPYDTKATAKDLIRVCLDQGLIPNFWESHYTSLRSLLESSVPTGRNRVAGHGQGPVPTKVPDHLVAYMLHMTAAAILFLGDAERALP